MIRRADDESRAEDEKHTENGFCYALGGLNMRYLR